MLATIVAKEAQVATIHAAPTMVLPYYRLHCTRYPHNHQTLVDEGDVIIVDDRGGVTVLIIGENVEWRWQVGRPSKVGGEPKERWHQ